MENNTKFSKLILFLFLIEQKTINASGIVEQDFVLFFVGVEWGIIFGD